MLIDGDRLVLELQDLDLSMGNMALVEARISGLLGTHAEEPTADIWGRLRKRGVTRLEICLDQNESNRTVLYNQPLPCHRAEIAKAQDQERP